MFFIRRLITAFQKALRKLGWFGLVRICFYPLTTLFTTPVRLFQALWSCRVLADGKWGDYPHFSPHTAINSLFYSTRALNLYRFGRSGRSPYLGLGDYHLSRTFHYSFPSLYAYWIAGVPTILAGLAGWWLSHLIWINTADKTIVAGVMGLALISPLFYYNLVRQNYNVLGWVFFPIGLYGLMTGRWAITGVAWLAASFGSFTVVVLGGLFSLVFSVFSWTIFPILAILPAGLKLAAHFLPLIDQRNFSKVTLGVAKAIGLVEGKAKYKRTKSKKINLKQIYLSLTYIQFLAAAYLLGGETSLIFLMGMLIYLVNSTSFRFADEQSMSMLMFSLGTVVAITISHPSILVFYWLLVSPPPRFLSFPSFANVNDMVPPISPFNIQPLLAGMEKFLTPVHKGQRILMAFDNPMGSYEKIFDGYRILLELPSYASTVKGIHFMPDWWGVFELNYEGAPDFWGRDIPSALRNIKQWKVDFLVIYQESGTELEPKWEEAGFRQVGKFAWSDYTEELQNAYEGLLPDWWLLEAPKS
ncbi:MAG: hypothetical protein HY865_13540 [Chloroflexi bacterium]|nr:hypothetical protein [Chloroflexota bacterium]